MVTECDDSVYRAVREAYVVGDEVKHASGGLQTANSEYTQSNGSHETGIPCDSVCSAAEGM